MNQTMNTIKEQFYKTTEQYFQESYENIVQHENQMPKPETKKRIVFEQGRSPRSNC